MGFCNKHGWRVREIGYECGFPFDFLKTVWLRSRQHQTALHPPPGFVTSHGAGTHYHPPDDLFGAVIGPGHFGIGVEHAIRRPVLVQPESSKPHSSNS